nr:hypothetical protein CFP56_50391 [Quercus suber]
MAPGATSPQHHAGLLWGQQLKREIAVVHKQHEQVKSSQAEQDRRLKAVEATSSHHYPEKIAALHNSIRDINVQGLRQSIQHLDQTVDDRFSDVHATNASMAARIDVLQKEGKAHRSELTIKEEVLLRRVTEAEHGLEQYRQNLEKLDRQPNKSQLDMISTELQRLREQLSREDKEMGLLQVGLAALEASNGELRRANERLGEELGSLKAETMIKGRSSTGRKGAAKKTFTAQPHDTETQERNERHAASTSDVLTTRAKNKRRSHSQLKNEHVVLGSASPAEDKRPSKRSKPNKLTGRVAKQYINHETKSPPSASNPKAKAPSHPSKWTQEGTNGAEKPVIRAGKGWIEVAEEIEEGSDSNETSSFAFDGLDVQDHASTQRLTRRARAQLHEQRKRPPPADDPSDKTKATFTQTSELVRASATAPGKLSRPRKSQPRLPSSSSQEAGSGMKSCGAVRRTLPPDLPQPDSEIEYELAPSPVHRRRVIEQSSEDVFVFDDA